MTGRAYGEEILGDLATPAPTRFQWFLGGLFAVVVHTLAALPFLPEPEPAPELGSGPSEISMEVRLAPIIQPPAQETPPPPEPDIEEQVIEERAEDSPPPAPPATPREIPELPDIRPKAVPDLWTGEGGGQLTLDEYLALQDWLRQAHRAVLGAVRYPESLRSREITGNARIVIVADRQGNIVEWRFLSRTGSDLLDREVERAIERIRRLPPFPEDTPYETLSYVVTIRFELVRADGTILSGPPTAAAQAASTESLPAGTLSVETMSSCAVSAAGLVDERSRIEAERLAIEADIAEFQRQATRYERSREELPRRLERDRERINERVAAFDPTVTALQRRVAAFEAVCGGGSTSYESYAEACRPYVATGNPYCEAFGAFWERLQAAR